MQHVQPRASICLLQVNTLHKNNFDYAIRGPVSACSSLTSFLRAMTDQPGATRNELAAQQIFLGVLERLIHGDEKI
jgi:hypothetical protein